MPGGPDRSEPPVAQVDDVAVGEPCYVDGCHEAAEGRSQRVAVVGIAYPGGVELPGVHLASELRNQVMEPTHVVEVAVGGDDHVEPTIGQYAADAGDHTVAPEPGPRIDEHRALSHHQIDVGIEWDSRIDYMDGHRTG